MLHPAWAPYTRWGWRLVGALVAVGLALLLSIELDHGVVPDVLEPLEGGAPDLARLPVVPSDTWGRVVGVGVVKPLSIIWDSDRPSDLNGSTQCLGLWTAGNLPVANLGGNELSIAPDGVLLVNETWCVPRGVCQILYGAAARLHPVHPFRGGYLDCHADRVAILCASSEYAGYAVPQCWSLSDLADHDVLVLAPSAAGSCGRVGTVAEPHAVRIDAPEDAPTQHQVGVPYVFVVPRLRLRFGELEFAEGELATGARVTLAATFQFQPNRSPAPTYIQIVAYNASNATLVAVCSPPSLALDPRMHVLPQVLEMAIPLAPNGSADLSAWNYMNDEDDEGYALDLEVRVVNMLANESLQLRAGQATPCGSSCLHACFRDEDVALGAHVQRVDACGLLVDPFVCDRAEYHADVEVLGAALVAGAAECYQTVRLTPTQSLNTTNAQSLGVLVSIQSINGVNAHGFVGSTVVAVDGFALDTPVEVTPGQPFFLGNLPAGYTTPAVGHDEVWLPHVTLVVRTQCAGGLIAADVSGTLTVVGPANCHHPPHPQTNMAPNLNYPTWAPPLEAGLNYSRIEGGYTRLNLAALPLLVTLRPFWIDEDDLVVKVAWKASRAKGPAANTTQPALAFLGWASAGGRNHSIVDDLSTTHHVQVSAAQTSVMCESASRCLVDVHVLWGRVQIVDIQTTFCLDCTAIDDVLGPDALVFHDALYLQLPPLTWPCDTYTKYSFRNGCWKGDAGVYRVCNHGSSVVSTYPADPNRRSWASPARFVAASPSIAVTPNDNCFDGAGSAPGPTSIATEPLDVVLGDIYNAYAFLPDPGNTFDRMCQTYGANTGDLIGNDAVNFLVRGWADASHLAPPNRALSSVVDIVLQPRGWAFDATVVGVEWDVGYAKYPVADYDPTHLGTADYEAYLTARHTVESRQEVHDIRSFNRALVPVFYTEPAVFAAHPDYTCISPYDRDDKEYPLDPASRIPDSDIYQKWQDREGLAVYRTTNGAAGAGGWFLANTSGPPDAHEHRVLKPVPPAFSASLVYPLVDMPRADVLLLCNVSDPTDDATAQLSAVLGGIIVQSARLSQSLHPLDPLYHELTKAGNAHRQLLRDNPALRFDFISSLNHLHRGATQQVAVLCAPLP